MQKRVLVVDDRPVMAEIITEIFDGSDVAVDKVHSGMEAISFVKDNDIDVVISDVMMPGMDGTGLFFQLKDINPFMQIIVMTAYPSVETIKEMIRSGATDFLLKPFEPEDLRRAVDDAFCRLSRWQILRQECV